MFSNGISNVHIDKKFQVMEFSDLFFGGISKTGYYQRKTTITGLLCKRHEICLMVGHYLVYYHLILCIRTVHYWYDWR
jgi:hypothetical protein